jgi:hypothetical protein
MFMARLIWSFAGIPDSAKLQCVRQILHKFETLLHWSQRSLHKAEYRELLEPRLGCPAGLGW